MKSVETIQGLPINAVIEHLTSDPLARLIHKTAATNGKSNGEFYGWAPLEPQVETSRSEKLQSR